MVDDSESWSGIEEQVGCSSGRSNTGSSDSRNSAWQDCLHAIAADG